MATNKLGVAIAAIAGFISTGQGVALAQAQNESAYERKPVDASGDAVRLFYLTHGETQLDIQEFANAIRIVADIQRIYPYFDRRTVSLRGTPDQIALAEWLFGRFDAPIDGQHAKPAAYEARGSNGQAEAVRVFYFSHNERAEDLQQVVNLLRTTVDLQRIYPYAPREAIVLRGTPDQIAVAEWLFGELNKGTVAQTNRIAAYPATAAIGRGDTVRLFLFAENTSDQDLQQMQNLIRTTADVQRSYPYAARRALALRGTSDQIALAEWLFDQIGSRRSQPK